MPPDVSGLYPRMRGADPADKVLKQPGRASTPAYAGLTRATPLARTSTTLYPRIRGADLNLAAHTAAQRPLPPRARG